MEMEKKVLLDYFLRQVFSEVDNTSSLPAWYSFEGTRSNVTVDTFALPGFESQLSILKGDCCSDLQCISFETDECLVTLPSTFKQEYWVLVSGLNLLGDTFAVAVDSNNYQCQNAVGPLSIRNVVRGSTATATNNDVGLCGSPGIHIAGVWYSFMGKGQNVTAFTCFAFVDVIASRLLSVFAGYCDDLTCIGIRSGGCGRQSWIQVGLQGKANCTVFLPAEPLSPALGTCNYLFNDANTTTTSKPPQRFKVRMCTL
jgi:hypothetical protein